VSEVTQLFVELGAVRDADDTEYRVSVDFFEYLLLRLFNPDPRRIGGKVSDGEPEGHAQTVLDVFRGSSHSEDRIRCQ
jgi:hypothetical protein